MTINLANRLVEFRKRFEYSQEDLSNLLDVSRQSISKWEAGEATPSIDYIKELARIYAVSVDDLLNVDKPIDDRYKKEEIKEEPEVVVVKDQETTKVVNVYRANSKIDFKFNHKEGIDYFEDDTAIYVRRKISRVRKVEDVLWIISSIATGLILLVYLLLGFFYTRTVFSVCWPYLLLGGFVSSIFKCLYYKQFRYLDVFTPCLALYLSYGMYTVHLGTNEGWHPYWLILLIPFFYYLVFTNIDKLLRLNRIRRIKKYSNKIVIEK